MNALITLVAVTGHQNNTPARIPVRPLEPGDIPELASLHRDIYADAGAQQRGRDLGWIGTSPDWGRNRTAEAASLVTSGPGGKITAAIIITERDGEAVIDELFTHPDHRRQGLAEELLLHCMHVLHTLGLSTVTVTVDENNSAAMALYLSRDFRRLTDDDAEYDYD
ncbi:GNAT family N-acetyltransferase [Arthrobacter oryzae]|uniref:Ribosomal protein S18 acetylase RimI-like enzyme n=1 Tax=Arthrobacter oryzae TaxID=409290 RepID=A0A495FN33_9MICC|nr:GNAT family N-acetyltransferase [Arthrobacter oryzae]RKR30147.1 ribosomal protein S18 acetylase RimI-like enzyme [Arthrobacter oryzae]